MPTNPLFGRYSLQINFNIVDFPDPFKPQIATFDLA